MSNVDRKGTGNQDDLLLWAGGVVLLLVAAVWLLVARPWTPATTRLVEPATAPALPRPSTTAAAATVRTTAEDDIGNPLRMAELAYDAGMLLEPEDYSAWTLYQRALRQDPGNPLALGGLIRVADALVRRGRIAGEQGRLDDARAIVSRVLEQLPDHGGAQSLGLVIDAAEARELAARERPESVPQEPFAPAPAATATPVDISGMPGVDENAGGDPALAEAADSTQALQQIEAEFSEALADNRLLAPPDRSARFHHARLIVSAPLDERTAQAGERLFQALMQRAGEAVALMDSDAAQTWLDEADQLNIHAQAVAALREELAQRLVTAESARPIPLSTLAMVSYVAPTYPSHALDRAIEGWVDLEFTVDTDGRPRDITITDASHETYFHHEALRAVERWRFEPREFMGRRIAQRSYTRLRFTIGD